MNDILYNNAWSFCLESLADYKNLKPFDKKLRKDYFEKFTRLDHWSNRVKKYYIKKFKSVKEYFCHQDY